MNVNAIVVLSLHSPKERIWGQLVDVSAAGVTVRGIDLNSFEDFIREVRDPETQDIGLPTLFFPMLRVERIALDEPRGSVASLGETFAQRVGHSLEEYLARFA